MKLIFIPSPYIHIKNGKMKAESYIPLGLLSLVTILKSKEKDVSILDINHELKDSTFKYIPEIIMKEDPDIIGFSTMCNQYPNILLLAKYCKNIKPNLKIILGGPEATITSEETISEFPFIDLIVRGECENTINDIVDNINKPKYLSLIDGLTFIHGKQVIKTRNSAPVTNLDHLPLPDYSLFPYLNEIDEISIEVGRGCPYHCTFCSTSEFWSRLYRLRSVNNIIKIMNPLYYQLGKRKFSFDHDNFTVSRKKVSKLVDEIYKKFPDIEWTCSSRADCLDKELIKKMGNSGCSSIFIGVETGSIRMQKTIKKNLSLKKVYTVADELIHAGIGYIMSFIIGFPQETENDLEKTIKMILEMNFRGNNNINTQLHLLAPVKGSILYNNYKERLKYDGHFSDRAIPCFDDDESLLLIKKYPNIFASFYYFDTENIPRDLLLKLEFFFLHIQFLPFTFEILYRCPEFDFFSFTFKYISLLEVNKEVKYSLGDIVNLNSIKALLIKYLKSKQLNGHYIKNVIEYEITCLNLLLNSKINSSVIQKYNYDVERIIDYISISHTTNFNQEDFHQSTSILFIHTKSKVKSVRLPSKLNV